MPTPDYILRLRAHIRHELLMTPAAAAVVFAEDGRVVLQRRADNGRWGLPGGMIEPGEEPAEAVVREVFEETGLRVVPVRISGVYGGQANMGQHMNGDRYAAISITFVCRIVGGTPTPDGSETLEVGYFSPNALPADTIPSAALRITHALTYPAAPYFTFENNWEHEE